MNIVEKLLANILSRGWWMLLLRGLIAIIFGLIVWFQPAISLKVLVLLFGAYALVDGIIATVNAISGRKEQEHWGVLLLWGLIGIGIGLLTFLAPGITALALLFYIAIWAIASGVIEIAIAIRLRKEMKNEWLLILCGLLSVVFGVILMARPGEGALTLLWLIGTYAVIFGILLVFLAFRVRAFGKRLAAS